MLRFLLLLGTAGWIGQELDQSFEYAWTISKDARGTSNNLPCALWVGGFVGSCQLLGLLELLLPEQLLCKTEGLQRALPFDLLDGLVFVEPLALVKLVDHGLGVRSVVQATSGSASNQVALEARFFARPTQLRLVHRLVVLSRLEIFSGYL